MKIDKLLCNGRKRLFMSYHHEALLEAKVPNRLHMTHDGMAVLQFLRKEQLYNESPHPDLVLLDLNLPPKADWRSWRKSSKIRRSEPSCDHLDQLICGWRRTVEL